MDDGEKEPGASGGTEPKGTGKCKGKTATRAGNGAAAPKKRPAAIRPVINAPPKTTATAKQMPKTPTTPPKKAEAKTKGSKVNSSKAFDKSWFKTAGPKYYGCVTVYVCQRTSCYRIKPGPGSRTDHKLSWGRTHQEQQSQWKKVMAKVRGFNKECP